jgi:hypothetical protein
MAGLKTVVFEAFVTTYSSGAVAEFHRLPVCSIWNIKPILVFRDQVRNYYMRSTIVSQEKNKFSLELIGFIILRGCW